MTTQRTQPSNDDPVVAPTDSTGPVASDKVGREALGLLLLSFGVLGGLGALGALHWTAGLSAALIGLCLSGVLVRRNSKPRWQQDAGAIAAFAGYAGQTAVLFYLLPPLGWLAVSALVAAAGLWLSSAEGA
ncbi:hypothetical protein [Streptomyces sp. 2131.1]|uniref:hypothetical protein n=1 Tax=Streptomyces sp. 2131.1 TaxID=1855346 RepID=UPI00115F80A5|nr:hypothetical protein [Streptomyces sp. 2131.1]